MAKREPYKKGAMRAFKEVCAEQVEEDAEHDEAMAIQAELYERYTPRQRREVRGENTAFLALLGWSE